MSNVSNGSPKKSQRSQNVQFEGGYSNENSEDDELEFEGGNGQRRRTNSRNPNASEQQYQQLSG